MLCAPFESLPNVFFGLGLEAVGVLFLEPFDGWLQASRLHSSGREMPTLSL